MHFSRKQCHEKCLKNLDFKIRVFSGLFQAEKGDFSNSPFCVPTHCHPLMLVWHCCSMAAMLLLLLVLVLSSFDAGAWPVCLLMSLLLVQQFRHSGQEGLQHLLADVLRRTDMICATAGRATDQAYYSRRRGPIFLDTPPNPDN